jgi:hypothetical protein
MKFNLTLKTIGKEYKTKGETVLEAIDSLGLEWPQIKGKGTITISQGKNSLEHLFVLSQMKRIFANKYNRLLWAKRLELLFNNKYNAVQ